MSCVGLVIYSRSYFLVVVVVFFGGNFFFITLLSLVALFVDKAVEIGISGRKRTFDKRSKKKDDGVKEEIKRSRD